MATRNCVHVSVKATARKGEKKRAHERERQHTRTYVHVCTCMCTCVLVCACVCACVCRYMAVFSKGPQNRMSDSPSAAASDLIVLCAHVYACVCVCLCLFCVYVSVYHHHKHNLWKSTMCGIRLPPLRAACRQALGRAVASPDESMTAE